MIHDSLANRKPNVLNLAANVYAGLSLADVTEVERIALDRQDFSLLDVGVARRTPCGILVGDGEENTR